MLSEGADAMAMQALAGSCAEFLVHGVDVEGKRLGIDEELVALLGQSSPIPVTYAGGATTMVQPNSASFAIGV